MPKGSSTLQALSLVIALSTLAFSSALIIDAYNAAGNAVFIQISDNSTGYVFMKPHDRLIITTNESAEVKIYHVADDSIVFDQTSQGISNFIFSPQVRGLYYVTIASHNSSSISIYTTLTGNNPEDNANYAYIAAIASIPFLALYVLSRKGLLSPFKLNRPGHSSEKRAIDKRSSVLTLLIYEFFVSRRIYFIPIFLLVFALAGAGYPAEANFCTCDKPSNPLSLDAGTSWGILFPMILVLVIYTYSYEKDRLILRSLFMNPLRASKLFLTKLLSVLLIAILPLTISFTLLFILFDPALFSSDPYLILTNLPDWIYIFILLVIVAVSFSLLPASFFKRTMIALLVPLFAVFLLQSEGFGISSYTPWQVWHLYGTFALSNEASNFDWYLFLNHASYDIAFATASFVISFLIFLRSDRE